MPSVAAENLFVILVKTTQKVCKKPNKEIGNTMSTSYSLFQNIFRIFFIVLSHRKYVPTELNMIFTYLKAMLDTDGIIYARIF